LTQNTKTLFILKMQSAIVIFGRRAANEQPGEAGLVLARRGGVRMMYRVAEPRVFKLLDLAGAMVRKQFTERAELLGSQ
jgi:hypothetical protein